MQKYSFSVKKEKEMHLFNIPSDSEKYANKCSDTDGVYFVPALTGLGAPY